MQGVACKPGDQLTPRQLQVKAAVVAFWAEHAVPPTVRDLCLMLGISSPNGVVCHLTSLAKKGAIEWPRDGTARGIFLPGLAAGIRAVVAELTKPETTPG